MKQLLLDLLAKIQAWTEWLMLFLGTNVTGPELITNGGFEGGNPKEFEQGFGILRRRAHSPDDPDIMPNWPTNKIPGWIVLPVIGDPGPAAETIAWMDAGYIDPGIKEPKPFHGITAARSEGLPVGGRFFVDLSNEGISFVQPFTGKQGGVLSAGVRSAQFPTINGALYQLTLLFGTYEAQVQDNGATDSSGPVSLHVGVGDVIHGRFDHPRMPGSEPPTQWLPRSLIFRANWDTQQVELRGWVPADFQAQRAVLGIGSVSHFVGVDNVSVRRLRIPVWAWPAAAVSTLVREAYRHFATER